MRVWAPRSYVLVGGDGDLACEPRSDTWFALVRGCLGGPAARPAEYAQVEGVGERIRGGKDVIRVDERATSIWRDSENHLSTLIARSQEGFLHPVMSWDGRWLVAAKFPLFPRRGVRELGTVPLCKIRLQDRRKFDVTLRGRTLLPVGWLQSSQRFLVTSLSPNIEPEYFLLDADNDALTPFTGEVRPLLTLRKRIPQPAASDVIWTALPAENGTEVGTYDMRTFVFHRVAHYPGLYFEANSMWVDAERRCVYAPCQGDLLRLPLPDV